MWDASLPCCLRVWALRLLICDIVRDEAAAAESGAEYVSLDELTASSDFISLHMPLTPKTRGMIDAHFFSRMKPGAFLINTSRGGVVNEGALIAALLNGTIAGARPSTYLSALLCRRTAPCSTWTTLC